MTYLAIALPFLLVALAVAVVGLWRIRSARRRRHLAALGITAAVLFVCTAIADNLMVAAGLFQFGSEHVVGVWLGRIPIEDFSYPLFALLLLPALWRLFGYPAMRREIDAGRKPWLDEPGTPPGGTGGFGGSADSIDSAGSIGSEGGNG